MFNNNMSTNTLAVKIFTTPAILGLILEYLDYNLNGHRCMARKRDGKRCTRKNCQITLLCSQHMIMWRKTFDISIFYHYKWHWKEQYELSGEQDILTVE